MAAGRQCHNTGQDYGRAESMRKATGGSSGHSGAKIHVSKQQNCCEKMIGLLYTRICDILGFD